MFGVIDVYTYDVPLWREIGRPRARAVVVTCRRVKFRGENDRNRETPQVAQVAAVHTSALTARIRCTFRTSRARCTRCTQNAFVPAGQRSSNRCIGGKPYPLPPTGQGRIYGR